MNNYKYEYILSDIKINLQEEVLVGIGGVGPLVKFYLTKNRLFSNKEILYSYLYWGKHKEMIISFSIGTDNVIVLECKRAK